ncbi:MAG: hypothetical protein IJJ57_04270, partial [Ruminococcus sp.]|nr:hypothetical protein [Ruminococcus sp.]
MINALYEPFPETIEADGTEYGIITDFREWFRFADMLADTDLTAEEKVVIAVQWLKTPPEQITEELITALMSFYRAVALEPDPPEEYEDARSEEPHRPLVFSYKYDAKYIIGDFRRFYGIDLLTAKM